MLKILLALMIMMSPLTSEEGKEIIEDESYKDDVYITVTYNDEYSELVDKDGNVVLTSNDDYNKETESFYRTTESYNVHRIYDKSFKEIGLYNKATIGDKTFIALTDGKGYVSTYTLYNEDKKVIKTISILDEIESFSEGLYLVKKDYKYGYMNEKGDIVIPIIYEDANSFVSGFALVETEKGYQYINKDNKLLTPDHTFSSYGSLENGHIIINDDYIDNTGKMLSKKEIFDIKYPLGVRAYYRDGYFRLVDFSDTLIADFEGDYMSSFKHDKAVIKNDKKSIIVNTKGEILFEASPKHLVNLFSNGQILVGDNEEYSLLDEELNIIKVFNDVDKFKSVYKDGLLGFYDLNGNLGFIDEKGKIVVKAHEDNKAIYDDTTPTVLFIDDSKFTSDGKYEWVLPYKDKNSAIINQNGDFVIEPSFSELGKFSDGLISASLYGDKGYINIKSEWVIPENYSHVTDFHNGLALVRKGVYDGKCFFIDTQGRVVKSLFSGDPSLLNGRFYIEAGEYSSAVYDSNGDEIDKDDLKIYSEDENGLYIEKNNVRTSDYYDYIDEYNDGYTAYKNPKTYLLDSNGKVISSKEGNYFFNDNSKYGFSFVQHYDGKRYLVDHNFKRVDNIDYDELEFLDHDYIAYKNDLEVGYFDENLNKTIIKNATSIDYVSLYSENNKTEKENKDFDLSSDSEFSSKDSIYYSPTGHAYISDYERISKLKEGRIKFVDRYTGYYDKDFNIVIGNIYYSGKDFSEGLASVSVDPNVSYYINYFGEKVSPSYMETTSFKSGFAVVKDSSGYGIIDSNYEFVVKSTAKAFIDADDKYYLIYDEETLIFDVKTQEISKVDYIIVSVLGDNNLVYIKDNLYGLVNESNKVLINEKYHSLFAEGKFLVFKEDFKEDNVLVNEVLSLYYDNELVYRYDSIKENKKNAVVSEDYISYYDRYKFSTYNDTILLGQYLINGKTRKIINHLFNISTYESISDGVLEYDENRINTNGKDLMFLGNQVNVSEGLIMVDKDEVYKYYDLDGNYKFKINLPGYISNFKDGYAINVHKGIAYKVNKKGQRLEELEVINLQSEDIHRLPENF